MRHRAISVTIAIAVMAATASCADDGARSGPDASGAPNREPDTPDPEPTVVPSGDCDALLEHYRAEAMKDVGPYGLGDSGFWAAEGRVVEDAAAGDEETFDTAGGDDSLEAGGTPGSTPGGGDLSDTNVQVEGVDEADRVKTDGELIYVLDDQRLRIVEPAADGVTERGRVKLGDTAWVDSMFLDGDTVVAIGNRWEAPADGPRDARVPGGPGGQYTELMEVDVSDPDEPETLRSLVIDGTPVASRLSNGVVRLVIESGPVGIEWETPEGRGLRSEMAATEANEELIRASTIENWLPAAIVDEDGELRERDIIGCGDVFVPSLPSGYGTITVMQVPIGDPLGEWNAGGLAATGAEVYATADDLYVATMDLDTWDVDDEATGTTSIHRFETPADGRPQYAASGQIEGRLLNQFSMDSYDDHLRVATTSGPPWGSDEQSESQVVVLRQEGDALVETGRVGELGKTERIHAVRFMEDTGYVVTFRQTDPLYVIDLSDPDEPALNGELKIPGFSNYLHPSGDGHLIGVGQHADPDSGMQEGLQVSLFDVTDPLSPERIDTYGLASGEGEEGGSHSPVQNDHRAFTEHAGRAYIPFNAYRWNRDERSESEEMGFLVVPLGATDFDDASTLVTGRQTWGRDDTGQSIKPAISVDRSVGIGDRLYGIGYNGVVTIDIDTDEVVDRHQWDR